MRSDYYFKKKSEADMKMRAVFVETGASITTSKFCE